MRLKIDIDDALMNEAFSCTKAKKVTELIHEALKEFIRIKKRKDITELAGRIHFDNNYDHKTMRTLRG